MTTLDELTEQLSRAARTPGDKQLLCARDVADALAASLPPPSPPALPGSLFHDAGVIAELLAVTIIVTPDAPPGTFRLVSHYDPERRAISCEVRGETVVHERCRVITEGVLSGD
jgi:hypothetical protein